MQKVNNWAVELESQNINFEFIAGTKNVLADTLSRLIEFNESIKLPEDEPGYEFGYTPFEELPPARVTVIEEVIISENQGDQSPGSLKIQHNDPIAKDIEIKLPLTNSRIEGPPGPRPTSRYDSENSGRKRSWTGNTSQWRMKS